MECVMPDAEDSSPTSELVRELSDTVSALVHLELRQAQLELSRKAREAARGGALLGVAGVLGGVAAGSSASIVRRRLDRAMPPVAAAATTTALFAAAAGAVAARAAVVLRRASPPVPEQTVASLRADLDAATPDR
jgi:hypothetical protein